MENPSNPRQENSKIIEVIAIPLCSCKTDALSLTMYNQSGIHPALGVADAVLEKNASQQLDFFKISFRIRIKQFKTIIAIAGFAVS